MLRGGFTMDRRRPRPSREIRRRMMMGRSCSPCNRPRPGRSRGGSRSGSRTCSPRRRARCRTMEPTVETTFSTTTADMIADSSTLMSTVVSGRESQQPRRPTLPGTTTTVRTSPTSSPFTNPRTMASVPTAAAQGPSPLFKGLVSLAVIAGVLLFIIVLLVLFLIWRKRRYPEIASANKNDTYHMYSEIDRTEIIQNDEREDSTSSPGVKPSAPPIPDDLYDRLKFNKAEENISHYSKIDQKAVNMNDPRLSNYDTTNGAQGNHQQDGYFCNTGPGYKTEPPERNGTKPPQGNGTKPPQGNGTKPPQGNGTKPPGNERELQDVKSMPDDQNYFVLENEGDIKNTTNPENTNTPISSSDNDNYFVIEKDDREGNTRNTSYEEIEKGDNHYVAIKDD